jgi:hypothetical protein
MKKQISEKSTKTLEQYRQQREVSVAAPVSKAASAPRAISELYAYQFSPRRIADQDKAFEPSPEVFEEEEEDITSLSDSKKLSKQPQ